MGGPIENELIPEDMSNDELPLNPMQQALEEIINYATTSPENINANVLRSMLYEFGEYLAESMYYMYNNSDEPAPLNPGNPVDTGSGKDK